MAIKPIRAREMLDQIEVTSHPHKKTSQQRSFITGLNNDISVNQEKKVLTTPELFAKLSGGRQ